jgi:hypothetical protein
MSGQLQRIKPGTTALALAPAAAPQMHRPDCFAGQPAACPGYFADDVLPCVCGVDGTALQALGRIAMPVVPPGKDEASNSQEMPLTA